MNLRMADLKAALEEAGFEDVRTLLSSGNALFTASAKNERALEKMCEAALAKRVGKAFPTIVRHVDALRELIEADPYKRLRLAAGSKRVVTFLRTPPASAPKLPIEQDGARILAVVGTQALSAYTRTPKGPVFMTLIEKTFGKDVTTRTWETVQKLAR
jgi:uncharacterized protein (DUF1697 family)